MCPKKIGQKTFLAPKNNCVKTKFVPEKNSWGKKKIWSKKCRSKKCCPNIYFLQSLVKIRSVSADMNKCCLGLCCFDKWHHDTLLKHVPGIYVYSLVQIESVPTEILLIWTIVARTNVAWTNVTMTVGICCRYSQDPTFKVWSKLGQ